MLRGILDKLIGPVVEFGRSRPMSHTEIKESVADGMLISVEFLEATAAVYPEKFEACEDAYLESHAVRLLGLVSPLSARTFSAGISTVSPVSKKMVKTRIVILQDMPDLEARVVALLEEHEVAQSEATV